MTYSMYELIQKQKRGEALNSGEIGFIVNAVTEGSVPDYQVAAWLMAVCLRGMGEGETLALTLALAASGSQNDLSALPGVKVDKHSTGGVGDKTTLIVAPLAAACGLTVAKMSGRGLGHTGGTVDKLEAVPGFRAELSAEEFQSIVRKTGLCVAGQSGSLAPADKKLYALRDVTATVDSIPLIAASVMSKKLAAGADCIVLDVKAGGGAFMKSPEDAAALGRVMVNIGKGAGRQVCALISDMNRPLGRAVGNALEAAEAWHVLCGGSPAGAEDLEALSLRIVTELLLLAAKRAPGQFPETREDCEALALAKLRDGSAAARLEAMLQAQGGDVSVLRKGFAPSALRREWVAAQEGYLVQMDAETVGLAALRLGAGRCSMKDTIDPAAGIVFHKKLGDFVRKGEPVALLCASREEQIDGALELLSTHTRVSEEPIVPMPLIYERIS